MIKISYMKNTIFLILISLIVSGACDRNRNHPGWDYFPDMFYSEAYESYTRNPNFPDGKTMRTPVEGTVPRDVVVFNYGPEEEERKRAGEELTNPFGNDEDAIYRGAEVYAAFCANCHGEKGDGKGFLHTSGKYIVVPRDISGETAKALKDGELYHSVSLGFGSMGSHASQISPDDRWRVISYIRNVLQSHGENEISE